jgi:hypothetical protein
MQKLISYHYIYLLPLLFSAIVSLRSFGGPWPKQYRLFSIFLLATVFVEFFALAWKWVLHDTGFWTFNKSNLWIYNAMAIARLVIYSLFYITLLKSTTLKKVVRFTMLVLAPVTLINYFVGETPHAINALNLITINIVSILWLLLFFRQLLLDEKLIVLYRDPAVWISLGTFLYCSGSIPFFIYLKFFATEYPSLAITFLLINHGLNIIMYILFSIAYLCKPVFRM